MRSVPKMLPLILLSFLQCAAAEDATAVAPLLILGPPLHSVLASVVTVESRITTYQVVCPTGPDKDPNCPRFDFVPPATVFAGPNKVGGIHTGRSGATTTWKCNIAGGENHALCQKSIVGPPPDLTVTASTTLGECDLATMSLVAVITAGVEKLSGGGQTGDAASLSSSLLAKASGLACPVVTTTRSAEMSTVEGGGTTSASTPIGTLPTTTGTSLPSQTTASTPPVTPNGAGSLSVWSPCVAVGAAVFGALAVL